MHWAAVAALSILIGLLAMRALALAPDDGLLYRHRDVRAESSATGLDWAGGFREEGQARG